MALTGRMCHFSQRTFFWPNQDPKEATRERIERLRREGGVGIDEPGHDKGSLPPALKPALKPGRAAVAEVWSRRLGLFIHQHQHHQCKVYATSVLLIHKGQPVMRWAHALPNVEIYCYVKLVIL